MDKNLIIGKDTAEELIEKIYEFKREKCDGLSLIETIIEYSFKFDVPIQEIGNVLSEHKIFMGIFEKQLIQDKYIKSDINKDNIEYNEDEW